MRLLLMPGQISTRTALSGMGRTAPRVMVDTLGFRLANTSTKLRAIVGRGTRLATDDNGFDNRTTYAPIAAYGRVSELESGYL
jgi:hypothetical protein